MVFERAHEGECFVLLCFEGAGWFMSATGVPWDGGPAHTVLSNHRGPVFPLFDGTWPVVAQGGREGGGGVGQRCDGFFLLGALVLWGGGQQQGPARGTRSC